MPMIDSRLLDCDGEAENTENFNRVLSLIDDIEDDVEGLDESIHSPASPFDIIYMKDTVTDDVYMLEITNGELVANLYTPTEQEGE